MDRRGRHRKAAGRTGRRAAAALVGSAIAIVLVGWGLLHATGPHRHWALSALASPLMLTCALVLLASGTLFAVLAAVLWRAGRSWRGRPRGQEGAAMIEFALALPIMLLLSLLMAQTALLMVGNLCVHYAAFCAARSAIVNVPKDFGDSEPRNYVQNGSDPLGKLQRIKMAAAWALMPVSCGSRDLQPSDVVLPEGLSRFFSVQGLSPPGWIDERLARKFGYALTHSEVTLRPPHVDGNDEDDYYDEAEDLQVTVTHILYLPIPGAAKIFAAFPGGVKLSFGRGEYGTEVSASCTLPNEGVQDYVDVEHFP